MVMIEKDQLKLEVRLVSSILNYAGHKGLLTYLSSEVYKKLIKDEYINYNKISQYSFSKHEKEWNHFMDKLVEMDLAVKNGSSYITRTKKKDWSEFCDKETSKCNKFNGHIIFNMTELYKARKRDDIKDLIYLSIRHSVIGEKSISRQFIKELTGVDKNTQRKIEQRQNETHCDVIEHHIPISYKEHKNGKVGDIPVFTGHVERNSMTCFKSKKKKSNCDVIQLGSKVKVKNLNLCHFLKNKKYINYSSTNNLSSLNKSSTKDGEVQHQNVELTLDTSGSYKSYKRDGYISTKDYKKQTWSYFKNSRFHKVAVLDNKGNLSDLRSCLNK